MPKHEIDAFLMDDEAAQEIRGEANAYPDMLKLVPMGLAKKDGKLGVLTALSCLCVVDPKSEDYGFLDLNQDNPCGLWECDPSSSFPGTRKTLFRSWAPVQIKGKYNEDLRTFVNALLTKIGWANGRANEVENTSSDAEVDAEVEKALADVGETE